ncbi:zinc finger MYND domain-containing protein 11 [Culicoides brevitarsis]|uniref:zinc finger MYND domain-containing protein 11 n=1 Tax=Culicoides brevitarsis TaxID=469753 RepID=UPI00307C5443
MQQQRRAPIVGVKIIWTAVRKLTNSKNGGSIKHDALVREVTSVGHFVNEDVVIHVIDDAVHDGILIKSEDGLRLKDADLNYPENLADWYCYECHSGGDVRKCDNCLRVFHMSCIKTDAQKQEFWDKLDYHVDKTQNKSFTYKEPVEQTQNLSISDNSNSRRFCYGCRLIHNGRAKYKDIGKEELNYLLTFVFNRVHSWVNEDTFSLQNNSVPKAAYIMENIELSIQHLMRFPTTIEMIKTKLANQEYTIFEELLRDILDVGHNLALVFGPHSAEFEASNFLFADAQFEIGEIKTCRDCYRHSNEKFDKNWFTVPCASREHQLVYAKAPGFPYWPAKVVKIHDDGKYDVRFFGGEHSRAIVHQRNIEPIDKNIKRLNSGKNVTKSLQVALNELKEHQKQLELPKEKFTFEGEKSTRAKKKCKFVPNKPTEVEKTEQKAKKRTQRTMSLPAARPTAAQRKLMEPKKPAKVIKTAEPEQKLPENQESRPESPKRIPVNFVKPMGPAPKRVKLERERKMMEEKSSNEVNFEENSLPSNKNEATNVEKSDKKENSLSKLENRLAKAKTIDEVRQISKEMMKKELESYQKKISKLKEKHEEEIRETKNKQWCKTCFESANYFCCWNTSYCSKECQRRDWELHRRTCKRKPQSK